MLYEVITSFQKFLKTGGIFLSYSQIGETRRVASARRLSAVERRRGIEMSGTLLSIEGLTKAYPGVVANDSVSFEIRDA